MRQPTARRLDAHSCVASRAPAGHRLTRAPQAGDPGSRAALAMELGQESGAQTLITALESVRVPGRLRRKRFAAALTVPMCWKAGLPPGLSRFRAS